MTEKTRITGTKLDIISHDIGKLAELLGHEENAVRELTDHELLALDAWTGGGNEIIRAECVRRAEQGRRFTGYLDLEADAELRNAREYMLQLDPGPRRKLLTQLLADLADVAELT